MINYVRIPRYILKCDGQDDVRVCTYVYLCRKRALDDTVGLTINSLVAGSGYKPNGRSGEINSKFVSVLKDFADDLHFHSYPNFDSCKYTDFIELKLNIDKFDILENFGIIFLSEADKILEHKTQAGKLLLILAYIRINKMRRGRGYVGKLSDKPEIYYRRFCDLAKDLNMAPRTVSNGVKILSEMDIIVYKEIPRKKDVSGNWRSHTNIFVDKCDGWEQELRWGEQLLI